MKNASILCASIFGHGVAARYEEKKLFDLIFDPASDRPAPESIYLARPDRPLKGQGGIMLNLGKSRAYLRDGKGLSHTRPVLVQITGYAETEKAPPATLRLMLKGRFAIITPTVAGINIARNIKNDKTRSALAAFGSRFKEQLGSAGLIFRSAALEANTQDMKTDIEKLLYRLDTLRQSIDDNTPREILPAPSAKELALREWPEEALKNNISPEISELEDQVLELAETLYPLPTGGSIAIEATRAFISVDVNTGGDLSPAASLKANISAARLLPQFLRLKGLGGVIVIDFAPMPKKNRQLVENALDIALRKDIVETIRIGWTTVGHMELQRKRIRQPISEILSDLKKA